MNTGTKIRSILALLTTVNIILIVFGVISFESPTVNIIYKIVSVILLIVSFTLSHYFNNDFSEEAAENTGYTRLCKKSKKEIIGENFFDEAEEIEGGEQDA